MDLIPLLKRLTETPGLSGFEQGIREQIQATWAPLVDEIRTDTLGNLIALKRGRGAEPRRKLMIAAHMDEIGLMVTQVKGSFLSITQVGGQDPRVLLGQPVLVHGRRDLPGVIGSRAPHVLSAEDRDKLVPWEKLVVDVGLPADELAQQVRVGDLITFRQELTELQGGRVTGKALDNRASVAAITVCLEALQSRTHDWDLLMVATVQEEETLAGALASTYQIVPEVGIALDVTFGDGPGVDKSETMSLGKGPSIGYGPNNHPGVHQGLVDAAKAIELPYQVEPMPRGAGTDAWAMEVVRCGIPTCVVSIPLRNMHMPVELGEVKDIERTGRLLAEFTACLDEDFMDKLAWDQDAAAEEK